MNRFLLNYLWDMMDVAKANGVDVGVGRDMFVANLQNFGIDGAEFYEGAPDVDYAAASEQWKAMSPKEQADAKTAAKKAMQDNYEDLTEARLVGSRGKFDYIVANYTAPAAEEPKFLLYKNAWEIWGKAAEEGTDLATAKDAYVETLEGWSDMSDDEKQAENEWFSAHVSEDDRNLVYAYTAGNRVLFDGLISA